MFQPLLPPDPLPAGPRVTGPLAPLLRLLLRVFNVALAGLALLMIASALWMGTHYHSEDAGRGGGDAPPPSPSPSPSPSPDLAPEAGSLPDMPGGASLAAAAAALHGVAGMLQEAAGEVASFPW